MTDEEKKAIEIIKYLQYKCIDENGTGMMSIYRLDDLGNAIKILLNLIEKQFKEIEELNKSDESKEQSSMNYYNLYRELEDKIKAKIEEIQQRRENDGECELALHGFQREAKIDVLHSLLEKE